MAILYNSNYNGTLPFSDVNFQISLTTSSEESFTVPGPATANYQALFSYNADANVFVCRNATPVVPGSGSVGTQQYNEFRPEKRYLRGGDVVNLISPDSGTTYVGVSLRQLNQS